MVFVFSFSSIQRAPTACFLLLCLGLSLLAPTASAQCRSLGRGCAGLPVPLTCGGATKLGFITLDSGALPPALTVYVLGTQLASPIPIPGQPAGPTCCPAASTLFVAPLAVVAVAGGFLGVNLPIDPALLAVEACAQGFVANPASTCLFATDAVGFVIFSGTK